MDSQGAVGNATCCRQPGGGSAGVSDGGPVLTMLTACVLPTRVGSSEASFLSCARPTIRYAATPATASSNAKPAPTSLGAQDPRDRERALRLPRIPNDYLYLACSARGCCEKLRPGSFIVTVGNHPGADQAYPLLARWRTAVGPGAGRRRGRLGSRPCPCDEGTRSACWPP